MGKEHDAELRVASHTPVADLAAAIANAVYDSRQVALRCVGAGAIAQAVKAHAVARGFVAPRGIDLAIVPGFIEIQMPDKMVTGMRLLVKVL